MRNFRKKTITAITACLIFVSVFGATTSALPGKAHAQVGSVPIGTSFDFQSIMKHLKDFVLDHLATLLAKQILHEMTISVINWINSGYQGSPGFVTDPAGFLADAADQVTGAFIAQSGPLSALCSPFSVDIRVSLALAQTQLWNTRYSCTLSTIINNFKNLPNNVYLNGQPISSDQAMQNFMNGDFSYGGWPAWMAMTTEPQNNPYGSFLEAQSELQTDIGMGHASLAFDLQLGQGFLSWDKCTDVTSQMMNGQNSQGLTQSQMNQLQASNNASVVYGYDKAGQANSIQKSVNPETDQVTFKQCVTATPGSAIASKLFTNINSPEVELELANDINAVINAMISQLVNQMLSKGLSSLSGGSAGGSSYTNQALQNIQQQTATGVAGAGQIVNQTLAPGMDTLSGYKSTYDEAVAVASSSEQSLEAAKQCFAGKLASGQFVQPAQTTFLQGQISYINNLITGTVSPYVSILVSKQAAAASALNSAYQGSGSYGTVNSLQNMPAYENSVSSSVDAVANSPVDMTTAQNDLQDANTKAIQWSKTAAQEQTACDIFPNSVYDSNIRYGGQ